MKASDVIAKVRQRLRDLDGKFWGDDELLDNLNMALSAIATDLSLWNGRWECIASSGVDTYSIPEDFMAPISLIINNEIVNIRAIDSAMRDNHSVTKAGFINMSSLIIYPKPVGGEMIVLNYRAVNMCEDHESYLNVGNEHLDSVIYYVMSLSLQKAPAENAMEQSRYYLKLYKDRIASISQITNKRRGGRAQSVFQKV